MKTFATRYYGRNRDKVAHVHTHFGDYPHAPQRDPAREVLSDTKSGTIEFDGTLWLYGECLDRGYFVE